MAKKNAFVYDPNFLANIHAGLVNQNGVEIKTEEAPKVEVEEKTSPKSKSKTKKSK